MRRRRVVVGLVVLAVGAVVATALTVSRPTPLEGRVGRIQSGMTLAEVCVVLGAPPGDHTRYVSYLRRGLHRSGSPTEEWDWDEGCVDVRFGPDGRVEDVSFYPNTDAPSAWDRVRYRLPW
jgi:hypothetical protein